MARIVVALGGNALQRNGEADAESQKQVARDTAQQLVTLIGEGHELIIVHGNGPQIGTILLNEEHNPGGASPLDTCGAMSQGEIGYWLQQALGNELRRQRIDRSVATIVTQIVVDPADPAFQNPTKPIGPFYANEQEATTALSGRKVVVKEDAGRGWRRVVASPQPIDIIEKTFIRQAIDSQCIVIAAGGGGIPVILHENQYKGIEAVIDKDFAAEKLAELVDASMLLILTGVEAVSINFRKPNERKLDSTTVSDLREYASQGQFAPGSMLPKVQAALRFVEGDEERVAIVTSPEKVTAALRGEAGTRIVPSSNT